MLRIISFTSVLLFATCIAYCACASLGGSTGTVKFGSSLGLSPSQYQTWKEWSKKRSFGASDKATPWGLDPFSNGDFQDWREYMNKRGFHVPDSPQTHQQFQSWLDWTKREQRETLGQTGQTSPFPNPENFGKFPTFQNWGDWYAKRAQDLSSPFRVQGSSPLFGSLGGSGGVGSNRGMQNWSEFMKRKGFGLAGSTPGLGHSDGAGLQSWNEWAKRFGPITTSGGQWGDFGTGGFGWGTKQQYTDWQGNFQHSAHKRQLGYTPHRFGSFHQYFTNGLQDWRSTFKGNKRSASRGGDNLQQDSSPVSNKQQEQ